MRLLLSLAAGLAITTVSFSAAAYADGAPGYTGKQGTSCTSCHTGNAAQPTVTITGPDSIAAGQTADYSMTVTTTLGRAAGGVAATDGLTLVAGTNFQEGGNELSHTSAVAVAGGKATFTFKVTAPATGGAMKLFAVGMGTNGTGTAGDGTSQITKDITITGGTTPTTPTTPETGTPAPAQTPSGDEAADEATPGSTTSTSTTSPSKSTTPSKKKKKPTKDDEEEEEDDGDPYARNGGCSTTRGGLDTSAMGAAAMVLFAFGLLRRRGQRSTGNVTT